MARPKELSTCALCRDDTPAVTRIEYRRQWVPVCGKHRMRILRYGTPHTLRQLLWVRDDDLRPLVVLVIREGLTYRAAAEQLMPGRNQGPHVTRVLRRWRRRLLEQQEQEGMSFASIARYWGVTAAHVSEHLERAREERAQGKKW